MQEFEIWKRSPKERFVQGLGFRRGAGESRGQRGMGTGGWRRAFCTAVRRDPGATEAAGEKKQAGDHEKKQQQQRAGPSHALSCAKLSFFSGGRDGCSALPELRCRTKSNGSKMRCSDAPTPTVNTSTSTAAAAAAVATADRRSSSPALFHRKAASAPSSLRSASEFGFFQHLSKVLFFTESIFHKKFQLWAVGFDCRTMKEKAE